MSQVLDSLEGKDPLDSRVLRLVCGINLGANPSHGTRALLDMSSPQGEPGSDGDRGPKGDRVRPPTLPCSPSSVGASWGGTFVGTWQ